MSNYKKLPKDPTVTHSKLINDAINRLKQEQLIPKENVERLILLILWDAVILIFQSLLTTTYN